jgi:uncharacterized membrane protein YobD (UPF0266 family)
VFSKPSSFFGLNHLLAEYIRECLLAQFLLLEENTVVLSMYALIVAISKSSGKNRILFFKNIFFAYNLRRIFSDSNQEDMHTVKIERQNKYETQLSALKKPLKSVSRI